MASFTSRLAGWAAGRLKGEKARQKTMEFVDKTGVGKLLSLAGDAALLGGAGKLAGMGAQAMGIGKAAKAAQAADAIKNTEAFLKANQGVISPLAGGSARSLAQQAAQGAVTAAPAVGRTMGQRMMAGAGDLMSRAGGAVDYIKARPEIAATALTTTAAARQAAANRALDRQALAQRESQFQQEFGLRKTEQEREIERQQRIAQMLAPLFQRIAGGQG